MTALTQTDTQPLAADAARSKARRRKRRRQSHASAPTDTVAVAAASAERQGAGEEEAEAGADELVDSPAEQPSSAAESLTAARRRYIVFVGNLPYRVTVAEVERLFSAMRPVGCRLPTEKDNRKPKGYAFVEFDDAANMRVRACSTQHCTALHHTAAVLASPLRCCSLQSWRARRVCVCVYICVCVCACVCACVCVSD